jgi:serine/threonine protein kinase
VDSILPSSDVEICYNHTQGILIKRPTKGIVDNVSDGPPIYFSKRFELPFGPTHAKKELIACEQVFMAQIPPPPEAWIYRLQDVVRDGNGLLGMLFTWIDTKGVLSEARAAQSSAQPRRRWETQIRGSLDKLYEQGINWGDVKAENVLIDKGDNAWVIDFGGSCTGG